MGLSEKTKTILRDKVNKWKTPTPYSWAVLATSYVDKQNMEKAFECMKEALVVRAENKGWRPKVTLISSILNWLGDK